VPDIHHIELPTIRWVRGRPGRFWLIQARYSLTGPPYLPNPIGSPSAVQLLEYALDYERANYVPSEEAPTFFMLPECSVLPSDVDHVRGLVRAARRNTVVIFGVGQLTEQQALALTGGVSLWEGHAEGVRYANCAVVATGGSRDIHIQPKVLASKWERGIHWSGRVVNYFTGGGVQFVVSICSDLLTEPGDANSASRIVEDLRRRNWPLNLVPWLQYNEKPRAPEFTAALDAFTDYGAMVVVAASRNTRLPRYANYAVSGAVVRQNMLPRHFEYLALPYHYVEPLKADLPTSRIVLLRYDADVYRVRTVLPDAIDPAANVTKGFIFDDSQPYEHVNGALVASGHHHHLADISALARQIASERYSQLVEAIARIADRLIKLSTLEFLAFLDMALLPQPALGTPRHPAGELHEGGDYRCMCWTHRRCVDFLADEQPSAEPVAEVLAAVAAVEQAGVSAQPVCYDRRRTVFRILVGDRARHIAAIFPFHADADGTEEILAGSRAATADILYIVLGTEGRPARMRTSEAIASRASPSGSNRASLAARPRLRVAYSAAFVSSVDRDEVPAFLTGQFAD
jgi:hypothetical protein